MTETLVTAALTVIGSAGGAWLAFRVELRWLRADLTRVEKRTDDHSTRIRALELET